MATTNQQGIISGKKQAPTTFASYIKAPAVMASIQSTLGSETKKNTFVANMISAINLNPALKECDFNTIISAGLIGESLNLSPSPQLGHYYMVPFNNTKANKKDAQFQLGYKGYIQLAIRSGQYKRLNVVDIKEGELIKFDPLTEEIEVSLIPDERKREMAKTTGYYAMFELVNGFRKAIYWSKEKMESHALKYSKGYAAKKGYTFWEKDFDGMAYKTMLRQLISKWGVMSVEMQKAYTSDYGIEREDGTIEYPDNVDSDFIQADYTESQVVEETGEIKE